MPKSEPTSADGPTTATKDGIPFRFGRKIELRGDERTYVRQCQTEVRQSLVEAQRNYDDFIPKWNLRNALSLYLVILGEIAAGRTIRYFEPLKPSVCMAAYLGQHRMLGILHRSGVPVPKLEWSTLNVLFGAILGRRLGTVKRLLADYPELRQSNNVWYGNAAAFCAGFGSLQTLRFLRVSGFDMRETHRRAHQPEFDPRRYGAPLLSALTERRREMVADLLSHGEFLPWEELYSTEGEGTTSIFVEAVRHGFPEVAKRYLKNGWCQSPADEKEFWDLACRTGARDNLVSFKILERSFPKFDAKRMVLDRASEDWFPAPIRRYCGAGRNKPAPSVMCNHSKPAEEVCGYIRDWVSAKRPDMVRHMLDQVPEVLPMVWAELADSIRAAFAETPSDSTPCHRYLFRLARSLGIALFPDDAACLFWKKKCEEPSCWDKALTMDEVFPYDEGLDDGGPFAGYLHPKDIRQKLYQAIRARGSAARRLMDDPTIRPNCDLSWNRPFFVRVGDETDWRTYKGWLLRGMEIYWDNMDDPGCFELGSTPSIVRNLLPELEHRPWVSRIFTGNTLVRAASFGDLRAVKGILDAGCPVNFSRWVPGDEISPLRAALLNGRDGVARLLYARGGMNILNGVVYPVPRWISKPRRLNLPAIRRAVGDPAAKPVEIDPITPLPAELSRLRNRWLEEAKKLNGNCLCLIPSADDVIVFRLRRRLYAIRRESFSMDNHAFEVSYDEICRDLERIGCERIQS